VIDCHTHVTSCRDDPSAVIARAAAAGVDRLITIGSSPEEMAAAAAVADAHDGVSVTAGLHPHSASEWNDAVAGEIRGRAGDSRCVAIGETGLDWYRDRAPRDDQLRAFHGQLEIARDLALPVVIHCRDAEADCFEILADEAPPIVVLHCFAAVGRLDEAVERGWFCSFAGNVTYPSASDLADAARRVPDELILLETDAPYLAPVPHRGRPNEPAYVMDTLRHVAGLRSVEPEALEALVERNARRAFPRLG
jgi:TatD DNase family protein